MASSGGAVYVFERTPVGWVETAKFSEAREPQSSLSSSFARQAAARSGLIQTS